MSDITPNQSVVLRAIDAARAVFSGCSLKQIIMVTGGGAMVWVFYRAYIRRFSPNTAGAPSKLSKGPPPHLRKTPSVWFQYLLVKVLSQKENLATVVVLIVLLLLRTLASVKVANDLGKAAELMVQRDITAAVTHIAKFALITIPIAGINSGIRATTELLSIQTRHVLSKLVHEQYLQDTKLYDVRYWCPENNKGERTKAITDAHTRVTRDVAELSNQISGLVTSIFKPLLDLAVFSSNVRREMGNQGLAIIWAYYIFVFFVKSRTGPTFARLSRRSAELEGRYASAEQRLSDNAEEVVFFGGAERERGLLTEMLRALTRQGYRSVSTLFAVGVLDQYLAKYLASVAGYITLSVPVVFNLDSIKGKSTADLTAAYSRNSRYLLNMGTAIREIALVSNKLGRAYGLVARLAELLERLEHLRKYPKLAPSPKDFACELQHAESDFLAAWRRNCDEWRPFTGEEAIEFRNVKIVAPDRRLLVDGLDVTLRPGDDCLLTGPNGAGKSSIFRTLGGLWPVAQGSIVRTPADLRVFFLTQSPYFVAGSLRDQVIYPMFVEEALQYCQLLPSGSKPTDAAINRLDECIRSLMDIVDPAKDITRRLDKVANWTRELSGGQRQLISMVRLAFQRPCFALLDECTSAVSAEKDSLIFEICQQLGITILSISHKHRMHRQYHNFELRLSGLGDGSYSYHPISEDQKAKSRELSMSAH